MTELSFDSIMRSGEHQGISLGDTDPAIALELYRFMVRLRKVQEELIKEYRPADEMRCPVHFCIGQEAMPAALSMLAEKDD